jgi:hypothetical protein
VKRKNDTGSQQALALVYRLPARRRPGRRINIKEVHGLFFDATKVHMKARTERKWKKSMTDLNLALLGIFVNQAL